MGGKSKRRIELEKCLGNITESQFNHRIRVMEEQLKGCISDEARRLIVHGIGSGKSKAGGPHRRAAS